MRGRDDGSFEAIWDAVAKADQPRVLPRIIDAKKTVADIAASLKIKRPNVVSVAQNRARSAMFEALIANENAARLIVTADVVTTLRCQDPERVRRWRRDPANKDIWPVIDGLLDRISVGRMATALDRDENLIRVARYGAVRRLLEPDTAAGSLPDIDVSGPDSQDQAPRSATEEALLLVRAMQRHLPSVMSGVLAGFGGVRGRFLAEQVESGWPHGGVKGGIRANDHGGRTRYLLVLAERLVAGKTRRASHLSELAAALGSEAFETAAGAVDPANADLVRRFLELRGRRMSAAEAHERLAAEVTIGGWPLSPEAVKQRVYGAASAMHKVLPGREVTAESESVAGKIHAHDPALVDSWLAAFTSDVERECARRLIKERESVSEVAADFENHVTEYELAASRYRWLRQLLEALPVGTNELMTIPETVESAHSAPLRDMAAIVAQEAARIVRDRFGDHGTVDTKDSYADLVTEVDRLSEGHIRGRLATLRPDDGFRGEEGGHQPGRTNVEWVVDPLDGTTNFIDGVPSFAVSIAAVVDGVPVAGAVVDVMTGTVYCAAEGHGATKRIGTGDPVPLRTKDARSLHGVIPWTGFSTKSDDRRRLQWQLLGSQLHTNPDLRRLGPASLDLCRVADGQSALFYEHGLSPWDWAAAALIAKEAGAWVITPTTDSDGSDGATTMACAPGIAAEVDREFRRAGHWAASPPSPIEKPRTPDMTGAPTTTLLPIVRRFPTRPQHSRPRSRERSN